MALVDFVGLTDLDDAAEGVQVEIGGETFILPEAPTPTLEVSNDGMLVAEATDYTMADMAPDMIEGWRGAVLTNMGGDTAVVYSDIGNDGTESLLDRYVSSLPGTDSPRSWAIDNDDLMEEAGGQDDTDNEDNDISWSDVMRPDDETMVSGVTVDAPTLTFMGTVHDISGMFSCTGVDCAAPARYSDDSVATATGAGNDWTFVPMRAPTSTRMTRPISPSAGGSTRAQTASPTTSASSPIMWVWMFGAWRKAS